jgi:FKBP-type peptidyl-prolyl cis-trans isomerase
MKRSLITFLAFATAATVFAAESTPNLKDQKERTSYALGVNFGNSLRSQGVEVDAQTLLKGLEDGLANKPELSDKDLRETFKTLRTEITARMQERAKTNKAAGEAFLAENAKKEGIKTLPGGLQYKVIKEGTGESPSTNDEVSVTYTGKLLDGTIFDSTEKHPNKQPSRFKVSGVIPGWTEALQHMKKGAEWELFIPSDLAYKTRGTPAIPPNSTLIFNVNLLDIFPGPKQTPATSSNQQVVSPIIKVPSAEELKKGAKPEVLKPEDVQREIEKERARKQAEQKK